MIAPYRAAQGLLDAEAKTALRQFVGAKKNCEVGTRAALSGAVDGVKFSAPHQPRLARKQIPVRTRTAPGPRAPPLLRRLPTPVPPSPPPPPPFPPPPPPS